MEKDIIMQSIEVLDEKIVAHYAGQQLPQPMYGGEIHEITDLTDGAMVGTPIDQIDTNGRLYSVEELLEKDLLQRGENEIVIYENGVYKVVPNFTHIKHWSKSTGQLVKLIIGDTPDDTMTTIERQDKDAVWENDGWVVTDEVLAGRIREKRNLLLSETDHLTQPDYPITNRDEMLAYRQALRDITNQDGFPTEVNWPEFEVEK